MRLPLPLDLPAVLQPLVVRNQQSLREAIAGLEGLDFDAWSPAQRHAFDQVAAASDFVLEVALREPAMFFALQASGELERPFAPGELRARIAAAGAERRGACAQPAP